MDTFTVIIETPAGSNQKFAYDENSNSFTLKKVLPQGMHFPFDFGFLPGTVGEDGDPLDVIVLSENTTFPGCRISCRIIGAFLVEQTVAPNSDQTIRNDRFVAIPSASLVFNHVRSIGDLPGAMISQLTAFFKNYIQQEEKELTVVQIHQAELAKSSIPKDSNRDTAAFLYELFLPLQDNTGIPIPRQSFDKLHQQLVEHFGGVTIYQRSPAKGLWKNNEQVVDDNLLVYEVMSNTHSATYWFRLKKQLEHQFRQQNILIRRNRVFTID